MCGVFYIDDDTMREIEKIARKIDRKLAAVGDVHPSQPALILRADKDETVSEVLNWGYESYRGRSLIFNARSETVQERPMFRRDFDTHRCLIPANKFYEWKQTDRKRKDKYEFFTSEKFMYLAGIYHKDPAGDRFAILTRAAEGCMEEVHHRMPLILNSRDMENWLFSQEGAARLLESHFDRLQKRQYKEDGYQQMSLF